MSIHTRQPQPTKGKWPRQIIDSRSHIRHPTPVRDRTGQSYVDPAQEEAALTAHRVPGALFDIPLGTRNTSMADSVTGKSLSRNMIAYVRDGGAARSTPPVIDFGNGVRGFGALPPTYALQIDVLTPGSGYSAATTLVLTGGGTPIRLPTATPTISGGTITAAGLQDFGLGLTDTVTCTAVDTTGTGATFRVRLFWAIRRINVTAGGSGYTWATITFTGLSYTGGSGKKVAPRAAAVISGGVITAIDIIDGGWGFNELVAAPGITIGGNGSGATATVDLGIAPVRAVVIEEFDAPQTAAVSPTTLAHPSGAGGDAASIGYRIGAAPTVNASSVTTILGGTEIPYDLNGLLTPLIDDNDFTIIAIVKLSTSGALRQSLLGTGTFISDNRGFYIINNPTGTYKAQDTSTVNAEVTIAKPGTAVNGDWVPLIVSLRPVPQSSATVSGGQRAQSYTSIIQIGEATAATSTTGLRREVDPSRLIGVGPVWTPGATYTKPVEISRVVGFNRGLNAAELAVALDRIVALEAAAGLTVVV